MKIFLCLQHATIYNVTAIFDNSGNVVERYIYDPYGSPSYLTGAWASRSASSYAWLYLHQAARWEVQSGLYHFRNRDLSPSLGLWLTLESIKFEAGDVNLYRYVGNSCLSLDDPFGLEGLVLTLRVTQPVLWRLLPIAANPPVGLAIVSVGLIGEWIYWKLRLEEELSIGKRLDEEIERVRRRKRDCFDRWMAERGRCFRIAKQMEKRGFSKKEINEWRRVCLERAMWNYYRCLQDLPPLPRWPRPW